MKKTRQGRPAAILLMITAIACHRSPTTGVVEHRFSGATMGTRYEVKIVAGEMTEKRREEVAGAIQEVLDGVDGAMSTYQERSEVSRFNRHRSREPFALSPPTMEVLRLAMEVWEASGGAFDPTVGPLVELWGFGPAPRDGVLPAAAEIESRLAHTGLALLSLSSTDDEVTKIDPRVEIDLSAIAKGYAADRAGKAIERLGYDRFMVEVGGEVTTGAFNLDGRAWQIAIERPVDGRAIQQIIALSGQSLATSGDYRNYYEIDGSRYSHTIDPSTGRPVLHPPASASVVHSSCALADGWATAMMVLGVERGLEIANDLDLAVLFVLHDDEKLLEHSSVAFARLAGTEGVD